MGFSRQEYWRGLSFYDLNKIPYDYTVEVINRFKGLDLIDRMPEEIWMEVHDIVQGTVIKTIPKKRKCKKALNMPANLGISAAATGLEKVSFHFNP